MRWPRCADVGTVWRGEWGARPMWVAEAPGSLGRLWKLPPRPQQEGLPKHPGGCLVVWGQSQMRAHASQVVWGGVPALPGTQGEKEGYVEEGGPSGGGWEEQGCPVWLSGCPSAHRRPGLGGVGSDLEPTPNEAPCYRVMSARRGHLSLVCSRVPRRPSDKSMKGSRMFGIRQTGILAHLGHTQPT